MGGWLKRTSGLLAVCCALALSGTGEAAPVGVLALASWTVSVGELPAVDLFCAAGDCVSPAVVTVATTPWTEVLIDDEKRGTTPLYRERLLPGRHRVRLVNRAAGIDLSRELWVDGARLTKVRAEFSAAADAADSSLWSAARPVDELAGDCARDLTTPAFLSVETTPWTSVWVDGRRVGATPLYRLAVAPGRHIVRLVNDEAGVDYETAVEVVEGQTYKLRPPGDLRRGRGVDF